MKIGNVEIDGNLFLAPMAGVTDLAMRSLAREFGASLSYTEMISAKGLIYKSAKTEHMLKCLDNENPKAVQIFGNDPEIMAQACLHPLIQHFDIIDINMGCPAPKIVRNGEGSALMENFELASEIIKRCVAVSNKPITVKFRKGFINDCAVEFAKMCERSGASAITIHGRTKQEMYGGKVDYEVIKKVKNSVSIPVFGSGDVVDEETFIKMKETGVDAIMIGRGSLGRVWIFSELAQKTVKYNRYEVAKKHVELLRRFYPENFLVKYMRKHLLWYCAGIKNVDNFKTEIAMGNSLDLSLEILKKYSNLVE